MMYTDEDKIVVNDDDNTIVVNNEENEKPVDDVQLDASYNSALTEPKAVTVEEILPEKAWYVINTFAQRERQVKEMLEKRAVSMNIQDKIFRIICAEYQEPVLDEDGKPKYTKNKTTGQMVQKFKTKNYYPGYIFVEMIMTDETWFVVRNTPGVSGITGSSGKGAKPFPIPREEIEPVLKRMNIDDPEMYSDYQVGDKIKILSGTFADAEGNIETVNPEESEVTISITLFGRPQIITAKYSEIEKADKNNEEAE